jgi:hypothetical protein
MENSMYKLFYGLGFAIGVALLAVIALLPGALAHLLIAWVAQWLLSFVHIYIPLLPLFLFIWLSSVVLGFLHRSK